MRHKEIKLPTAQCDVIGESSCSSTSWERVGKNRWDERGACTQRCVCIYVCIYRATKTYTKMAQTATIIRWMGWNIDM